MNESKTAPQIGKPIDGSIILPADCRKDFIKAMKIGYYKILLKNALITNPQFEILMQMQNEKEMV